MFRVCNLLRQVSELLIGSLQKLMVVDNVKVEESEVLPTVQLGIVVSKGIRSIQESPWLE